MIGIVAYEAGNIASVSNALGNLGVPFVVADDIDRLSQCDGIILPGVGAAPGAMEALARRNLIHFLRDYSRPLLGICLGMQLLFDSSEEGSTTCIGIIEGSVRAMNNDVAKVPHMGWKRVDHRADFPLALTLPKGAYFYFAHSYYAPVVPPTRATAECGITFSAAIQKGNFFGVQYHPEKSGRDGLTVLKNFISICSSSRR
jgi:glutamine amidotransferase